MISLYPQRAQGHLVFFHGAAGRAAKLHILVNEQAVQFYKEYSGIGGLFAGSVEAGRLVRYFHGVPQARCLVGIKAGGVAFILVLAVGLAGVTALINSAAIIIFRIFHAPAVK
ncbi:hypothetical protein FQZ97_1129140 [compost metagenome]